VELASARWEKKRRKKLGDGKTIVVQKKRTRPLSALLLPAFVAFSFFSLHQQIKSTFFATKKNGP
jgi:hypothetical protein